MDTCWKILFALLVGALPCAACGSESGKSAPPAPAELQEVARGTVTISFDTVLGDPQPNMTGPFVMTSVDLDTSSARYGGKSTLGNDADLELQVHARQLTLDFRPVRGQTLRYAPTGASGRECLAALERPEDPKQVKGTILGERAPTTAACLTTTSGHITRFHVNAVRHGDLGRERHIEVELTYVTWRRP